MDGYRGFRLVSYFHNFIGGDAERHRLGMMLLVVGLFTPVFFQWEHGLYQGSYSHESGGRLASLPVPGSILFCCLGMLLMGGYMRARRVLVVIFFAFIGMWLSVLWLAGGRDSCGQLSKMLLLAQYMLPMPALIVGFQAGSFPYALHILARGLLGVLLVVISLQLTATMISGQRILSSSVLLFGVYQNLQYVPVIFVGSYLISLSILWRIPSMHVWLLVLGGMIGGYAALSISMLALFLLLAGVLIFVVISLLGGVYRFRVLMLLFLLMAGMGLGLVYASGSPLLAIKFNTVAAEFEPAVGAAIDGTVVKEVSLERAERSTVTVPLNLGERIEFWDYYLRGVGDSWGAFLIGHVCPPERSIFPSAHNYYLDFVYNFGFLAVLPLLALLLHTLHGVWKSRGRFWGEPGMSAVAGVSLFILVVDNSLKVGMRQPYPGIVSFFLWGFLLAWLWRSEEVPKKRAVEP